MSLIQPVVLNSSLLQGLENELFFQAYAGAKDTQLYLPGSIAATSRA